MQTIRTTLFLPVKTHRKLKLLSRQRDVSMARLVQEALGVSFFGKKRKQGANTLWGCAKNTDLKPAEFQSLKSIWHRKAL